MRIRILAALACLAFANAVPTAEPHRHDAMPGASGQLQLDNGKRWATDAPLRRGMTEIRAQVADAPRALHSGKARPAG